MDPNALLTQIRDLSLKIRLGDGSEGDAEELADKINDLDRWLMRGSYLPNQWWQARAIAATEGVATGCPVRYIPVTIRDEQS